MKLHRPGTEVRTIVPSTTVLPEGQQCYVTLKVLSLADKKFLDSLSEQSLPDTEVARRMFGQFITDYEGFYHADSGEPINFEKDSSGYLTPESCAYLIPIIGELAQMIRGSGTLTEHERKNSA